MDPTMVDDTHQTAVRKPWYRQLYACALVAIVLGILVGWLAPETGEAMQPIGTTFVEAMKMLIGPIVFLTIVGGIASVANLKKVGVTGLKALGDLQIGSSLAMLTGLVAINIFRLGDGVDADASTIETTGSAAELIEKGENQQWWELLTHIIPGSVAAPSWRVTSFRSSPWPWSSASPSMPSVRSARRSWTGSSA